MNSSLIRVARVESLALQGYYSSRRVRRVHQVEIITKECSRTMLINSRICMGRQPEGYLSNPLPIRRASCHQGKS